MEKFVLGDSNTTVTILYTEGKFTVSLADGEGKPSTSTEVTPAELEDLSAVCGFMAGRAQSGG